VLAYVTCSPHLAVTKGIVVDALERHGDVLEAQPTAETVQAFTSERLDLAGNPDTVQLWPHRHLTDAMFIALLRKRSA
jgi:16S rRNA (cytosine967-C5)-methyltransferase